MWGYIIAINPKRVKNKLLKALSLLDFYFMIILTRTMFKNTYTDIEVKKKCFHHYKNKQQNDSQNSEFTPYYQNLNCMKK